MSGCVGDKPGHVDRGLVVVDSLGDGGVGIVCTSLRLDPDLAFSVDGALCGGKGRGAGVDRPNETGCLVGVVDAVPIARCTACWPHPASAVSSVCADVFIAAPAEFTAAPGLEAITHRHQRKQFPAHDGGQRINERFVGAVILRDEWILPIGGYRSPVEPSEQPGIQRSSQVHAWGAYQV